MPSLNDLAEQMKQVELTWECEGGADIMYCLSFISANLCNGTEPGLRKAPHSLQPHAVTAWQFLTFF